MEIAFTCFTFLAIVIFFVFQTKSNNRCVRAVRRRLNFENDNDLSTLGGQSSYTNIDSITIQSASLILMVFLFILTCMFSRSEKIKEVRYFWAILNSIHIGLAYFCASINNKSFRFKILRPLVKNSPISSNEVNTECKRNRYSINSFLSGVFLGMPFVIFYIKDKIGDNWLPKNAYEFCMLSVLLILTLAYISSFTKRFFILNWLMDKIEQVDDDENVSKLLIRIKSFITGSLILLSLTFASGIISTYFYLISEDYERAKQAAVLAIMIALIYAIFISLIFINLRIRLSHEVYKLANRYFPPRLYFERNKELTFERNKKALISKIGNEFNWFDLLKIVVSIFGPLIAIIISVIIKNPFD